MVLVMLLILMVMGIMAMDWVMLVWVITDMVIIWATTERERPRPSQLPRLMPKLPQRPTPGCTTPTLDTDSTPTDMATTAMVWAMLPMLDITRTLTTEAAEMATEPWFPVPGNSVEVS